MLLRIFPPPIIKCNEQYYRFNFPSEIVNEKILDDNFKAAAVFQLMRVIYDLLLSKTREQFNQNIACPAFESCEFGFRDEYICKRSPWKIKEKSVNTTCYYGMALFNYGLFKDDIDLDVSKMT